MTIQEMLLRRLKAQNPRAYEALMGIKRSGRDPNEVLREMRANGQITDSQLAQAERQARLLGANPQSGGRKPEPRAESPFKGVF